MSVTPAQGVSRRGLLGGALVSGVGAALTAPAARAAQEATPMAGPGGATIETVSGQAVYTLPRDHRWHGGPFYATDTYWERHYWTAFVTDTDTGEEGGLFYTTMRNAFNPATGEPVVQNYLSFTNFATQAFFSSSRYALAGGEQATLPAESTGPDDVAYSIDSGDGLSLRERYEHADERWVFQVSSAASADRAALAFDVAMVLEAPGYPPTTPTGLEEEGYSRDGLYNPTVSPITTMPPRWPSPARSTSAMRLIASQAPPGWSINGAITRPPIPRRTAGAGAACALLTAAASIGGNGSADRTTRRCTTSTTSPSTPTMGR
jgi:hypothetical protein